MQPIQITASGRWLESLLWTKRAAANGISNASATSTRRRSSSATPSEGENQMSVECAEGVSYVSGDPCIATFSGGACPETQEGLPYGSYSGVVASGVYGCKTYTEPQIEAPTTEVPIPEPTTEVPVTEKAPTTETPTTEPPTVIPVPLTPFTNCSMGSTHVSVQGLKNSYCVDESVCVQQVSDGNCPAPQEGLQFGSFCDLLKTGVYGCKPYTADNMPTNVTYDAPLNCTGNPAGETPVSIASADQDFCAPEPVCFRQLPADPGRPATGSACMIVDTDVYGCVFMAST